jgi:hypothetical protein
MKKIDLGQGISALANIGVIASIVFLGIQLRDSSIQARVATNQELTSQLSDWDDLIVSDESLADIYSRGIKDYSVLLPVEKTRFDVLMTSRIRLLNSSLLALQEGVIGIGAGDVDLASATVTGPIRILLDHPGFRDWWSKADRREFGARSVTAMDELEELRLNSE